MSVASTTTAASTNLGFAINPKDTKYFDFVSKFKKEAAYFEKERTASGKPWPRPKSPKEIEYDNFLAEVIDPTTGDYYLDEDGIIPAKYVVDMIIRQKQIDGSEVLLSQGNLIALDYFKDRKVFRVDKPEMHVKTIFDHKRELDKKRRIIRVTKGPIGSEEIYEMPFTPENLDKLWSRKRDGNIQLIVKSQLNAEPHALERKGILRANDVEGAYNLFKTADFDYLYNWEYQKDVPKPTVEPPKAEPLLVAAGNTPSNLIVATSEPENELKPAQGKEKLTDKELNDMMESDYNAMVQMEKDRVALEKAKPDTSKTKINDSDSPKKVK